MIKTPESVRYAKKVWSHMNDRCYAPYVTNEKPSYLECVNHFKDVNSFLDWCHDSPGFLEVHDNQKWGLDKDILNQGNKIYSPQNCCFVPEFVNNVFLIRNAKRGNFPCGVTQTYKSSTYKARCHTFSGRLEVSGFKTPLSAHMKWAELKAGHTLEVAERYKSLEGSREDVVQAIMVRYHQLMLAIEQKTEVLFL